MSKKKLGYDFDLSKNSKIINIGPLESFPVKENAEIYEFSPERANATQEEEAVSKGSSGVNNLEISSTIVKKKNRYILKRGAAVILGAAVVWGAVNLDKHMNKETHDGDPIGPVYHDPIEDDFLALSEVDTKDLLVVLNQTGEVSPITMVAEELLEEAGIDVVLTNNLDEVSEVLTNSEAKAPLVIDVNKNINAGDNLVVLGKHANDDRKKSDLLSFSLSQELSNIDDVSFRAGKGSYTTERSATDLEELVDNSKVAIATIALKEEKELNPQYANSTALAIYNSAVKYAYTQEKFVDDNIFHNSTGGDSFTVLDDKYKYKVVRADSDSRDGMLYQDVVLRVGELPRELNKEVKVQASKSLTANPDHLEVTTKEYTVKPGDTLSHIRKNLNNKNVGAGLPNPNLITVGQVIEYETTEDGPLFVHPLMASGQKALTITEPEKTTTK